MRREDSPFVMRVAAIDIGSNSIKLLVAERGDDSEPIRTVEHAIEETRLGGGLADSSRTLPPETVQRAVDSVQRLLSKARGAGAEVVQLTATSAVRDSANRDAFRSRLEAETGLPLRILSGTEEAELIAHGLQQDPALKGRAEIELADLGGGSLELVSYAGVRIGQSISLPLGAVRMQQLFIGHPEDPIPAETIGLVSEHALDSLRTSGFSFPKSDRLIVGLGGSMTLVRELLAGRTGVPTAAFRQTILRSDFDVLLDSIASKPLDARKSLPNMNPARADVIVPGLAVLRTLLDFSGRPGYVQSHYNLRYGVAAGLLAIY